jgi:hypothetical protein
VEARAATVAVHVVLEHVGGPAGAGDVEEIKLEIHEVDPGRDDEIDEGVVQLDHGVAFLISGGDVR